MNFHGTGIDVGFECIEIIREGRKLERHGWRILDFGFWILDFGFWILDYGLRISDCGFLILAAAGSLLPQHCSVVGANSNNANINEITE
jgi:hypothetical protein